MKMSLMIFALVAGFVVQETPPLEVMLDRINGNIQELQNTLPDITCKEKFTLRSTTRGISGFSQEALMTTSRFSGRGNVYFRVSRQVTSIKGTPSELINRIQNLLADVTLAFGPSSRSSTNYKFVRKENLRGVPVYVIEFETRRGASSSNRGGTLIGLGDPRNITKGKGWIDSSTMQVLRLELSQLNIPGRSSKEDSVLDYDAVNIDGKAFWLLIKLSKKDNVGINVEAAYSECRRFEVTSQIRPVQ
jgi:hypothetical protein